MQIIDKRKDLESSIADKKRQMQQIAFVPTMGALHKGHLSLVEKSKKDHHFCVISIFVNPTQFNDKNDYDRYPRNFEADIKMLSPYLEEDDIVFIPDEKEVYPEKDTRIFSFGMLDKVMEAKHRPGHFNGVAQVLTRLFDMVKPDKAYFGEKDFQQVAIVRKLVEMLDYKIHIVACPTIRESDGLAFSSRNMLLTSEERSLAPLLYMSLTKAAELKKKYNPTDVIRHIIKEIKEYPAFRLEYFAIVNSDTLLPVSKWSEPGDKKACIAAYLGKVRLIDNMTI